MITRLIQLGLLCGSLLGTLLLYLLFLRLSEGRFGSINVYVFIGLVGAYLYGATAFLAMKGIRFFSKPD